MELTLTVPMPPSVTNASGRSRHWRTGHHERNAYWQLLDTLQATGKIPPPPLRPFAKAAVRSVMYLGGAMDDDNALARHKRLGDWLVTRGYLTSDRRTCLRWEGLPEQIIKRDGNYRIVLVLTPVPEDEGNG